MAESTQIDTPCEQLALKRHLGVFGIVVFCVYYVADVFLDAVLFSEGTFLQQMLHPEIHEVCIRLLAGTFLTLALCYCWTLLRRTKQAELSLKRANQTLSHANRDLEMFNHSLAHDLKNPLCAISAAAHVLADADNGEPDQITISANMIQQSIERMDGTINALLKLADIEGQLMEPQRIDLSKVVQAALEEHQESNPGRQIYFKITPGLSVSGDREMLCLAIDNLVENAIKFTAEQPTAELSFHQVSLENGAAFCLADNGCGFPADAAQRIFQPFFREHEKSHPGTGIGLATVQRIIERHNGQIYAESEPGKGARFIFSLPDA